MNISKNISGEYLSAVDVKDGDKVKFLNEGTSSTIEDRPIITFKVEFNGEDKKYTPNKTTLRNLATAWGEETKSWIGKTATCEKIKSNIKGKMMTVLYLSVEESEAEIDIEQ
jgi:hypothetical protein